MRRPSVVLAVILVAVLLVAEGCRRETGVVQGGSRPAGMQVANAQMPQSLLRSNSCLSAVGEPTGIAAARPAARPGDPPHIISCLPGVSALVLSRELPADYVVIRIVQDDGVTPVCPSECRVSGPAASGGPTEWFSPGGMFWALGNPAEGPLTVEVRADGFDDAKRRVELPSREDRLQACAVRGPGRLDGPAVVIKMGRLRYRLLGVRALSPRRRPPVVRSTGMQVVWLGEHLNRTERVVFSVDDTRRSALVSLRVPEGAQRARLRPEAGWLPADVELSPRVVRTSATLAACGSCSAAGTVTFPDGTPAQGAQVYLWVDGAYLDHASCDPEGRYRLDSVPPGRLELVAASPGSTHCAPYRCEYDGASELTIPRLALGAGGCLVVTVSNPGEAVRGPITLIARTEGQSVGGKLLAGQTLYPRSQASPGVYGLQPLTPGVWSLTVDADGHYRGQRTVQVVAGQTTAVTITVLPHRSVRSLILKADGKPVGATEVRCTLTYPPDPMSGHSRPPSPLAARTRDDGSLRLDEVGQAQSLAVVTRHGHGRLDRLESLASAAGRVTSEIRLLPPATVRGSIKLPEGVRLPRRGMAVALYAGGETPGLEPLAEGWNELGSRPDDALDNLRIVFEPDEPRFRFAGVVPADAGWKLHLFAPGLVARPVPLSLKPGETTIADLEALTAGALRGRVVDSRGRPVPHTGVYGYMGRPGQTPEAELPRECRTDTDGLFEARGLLPGEWYVLTRHGNRQGCVRVQVIGGKTSEANLVLVRRLRG